MSELPGGLEPSDEIEVTWERDEFSTKVTATLGEASIVVETSEDGSPIVPWMVAALPSILEAAWSAIESENDPEEPK
jgi:hypothetical protein